MDNKFGKVFSYVRRFDLPALACTLVLIALIGCVYLIIKFQQSTGGEFPDNLTGWSTFAAMLSGTFGMLAGFAAVATLLIVVRQFKKQSEIAEKQIQSIEFDRYDRHRRIFFERLDGVEKLLDNEILIYNKEELYQNVYPRNSPMNCEVEINLETSDPERFGGLSDIVASMEAIKDSFNKMENASEGIEGLITMQGLLRIDPVGEKEIGDIYLGKKRIGINIYNISECIDRMVKVIDTMLVYSGNDKLSSQYFVFSQGAHIQDKLIKEAYRLRIRSAEDSLNVCGDEVHDIYLDMYINFMDFKVVYPITDEYQTLFNTLQNIMDNKKIREGYIGKAANVFSIRQLLLNDKMRGCLNAGDLDYVQKIELKLKNKETLLSL